MNDCPNAEMRDRLPDLIHERLDLSERALVVAHVSDCIDCQEELELLRSLRGALATRAPRMDVAFIVGALPKAPHPASVPMARSRRSWANWRIAAAATLLIVGGSSVALLNHPQGGGTGSGRTSAVVAQPVPAQSTAPAPVAVAPDAGANTASPSAATDGTPTVATVADANVSADAGATDASATDAGTDARLAGLDERQLKTLLGQIDHLEALPVTEPEPVSIGVTSTNSGVPEIEW